VGDPAIRPELTIDQLIDRYPVLAEFFVARSMACVGCYIAGFHTLADVSSIYAVETDALIGDLTAFLKEYQPPYAAPDTLDD
jgi:hybrid cluster-associated redox disulfide protein